MKRFALRPLITALTFGSLLGFSSQAISSGFQLFEQDGASIGNYHAGYAALAEDASTAWYNPAGITRFKNQQIVFSADSIMTDFKYRGSVAVTETVPKIVPTTAFPFRALVVSPTTVSFPGVTAQGGTFSVVPALHYVTPLNEYLGFGFSIDVPFGLKTNYGRTTPLRYAATLTSLSLIDISPSLALKVSDKGSIGAGFDIQKASAEFDSVAVLLTPVPSITGLIPPLTTAIVAGPTANSVNKATGTGYGYHLGVLYEFTPETRAGISYHSQVVHHLTGSSNLSGPAATAINGGPFSTGRASANITLPPYTAISAFHRINPEFAVMGSVIYTEWSTFQTINLKNVAGGISTSVSPFVAPSRTILVSIPEKYRNTLNFAVGGNYYPMDNIILRAGIGYDQTPVPNAYRNIQLPDNNRYVIALGGHYQISKAVGIDLGWTHFFLNQAHVAPPPQITGGQTVTVSGNVKGGADVLGGQIVWDIV